MSGSGGYYRYRCKYFYTHDCPNWVYVNHTACATCSSQGRELEPISAQISAMKYEICVPRVEAGVLYYTLVEVEDASTGVVTYKSTQICQLPMTTTALPSPPVTTASF
ncbi:hypothetical protein GGS21DRAFT_494391 [Xylaria nigripes]|nr:hypothetical protein GGS21DRAFT_494391 [Xylaria nigripes]